MLRLLPLLLLLSLPALGQTDMRNLSVGAVAETPVAAAAPAGETLHPPPTIADLVLLLKSYKPDPERIARLREAVDAPVPESVSAADAAVAWHSKSLAADELQEFDRRAEFLAKALEAATRARGLPPGQLGGVMRIRSDIADNMLKDKGAVEALESYIDLAAALEKGPLGGLVIRTYVQLVKLYLQLGDIEKARNALARAESAFEGLSTRRAAAQNLGNWSRMIQVARGGILRHQGRVEEEERAYRAALRLAEERTAQYESGQQGARWAVKSRAEDSQDGISILLAQTLAAQEKLDDAELMLREVLKRALVRDGRDSPIAGRALSTLASVFLARGRTAEALVIGEWAERALGEAGISERSPVRLRTRMVLANALAAAGRHKESAEATDRLRAALKNDPRLEDGFARGTLGSIRSFLLVGRIDDALRDGDRLLAFRAASFGADHYQTAEARGFRAMALYRAGRVEEARTEFARAIAVLTDPGKKSGRDRVSLARSNHLRQIINEYMAVLVGRKGTGRDADIAEAFRVADVARWQTVQKAVAGSALRAASGDPELGARIKKVQDADDELEAVYKNLISQRSAPPERQLPAVIAAMEARIAALQKEQARDLADIRRQFPQYDALVNPRPADLATLRKALRPKEALLSIYVTPGGTYSWATGATGELRFHFSPRRPAWIAERVAKLRAGVDLAAGDIERMGFDLVAGSELYDELLAPVREAWRGADTLLVVSNDSLAQLPFSLLPTAKAALTTGGVPLEGYRSVPWLARDIAVAYLPSVSALVTLRSIPSGDSKREPFLGFGDPDFGASAPARTGGARGTHGSRVRNLSITHAANWDEQATNPDVVPVAAAASANAEATPVLTPLPDTREEITAIATALGADVRRNAYFGAQANRQTVQEADLRNRRIVAFATHGLVAGDLPGLDQPALALAPPPGGAIDAGLLKLEHILRLSLNADLVVLSACNTAAADGSGAEAVSGLGRGFFYAGARAVLATHWPVETVSARDLVTQLFQRYARDPKLTRAAALRQAMLELIDRGVARDAAGKAEYAYAHPAFWAPYALYGDPGR